MRKALLLSLPSPRISTLCTSVFEPVCASERVSLGEGGKMESLPVEVVAYLVRFVSLASLASLARVSKALNAQARDAFASRLRTLGYQRSSLPHTGWSDAVKVNWSLAVQARMDVWDGRAQQLGGDWARQCMPVLLARPRGDQSIRIVVAKGIQMEVWEVDTAGRTWDLLRVNGGLRQDSAAAIAGLGRAVDDITGVTAIEGYEDDLIVSRVSGQLQRLRFIMPGHHGDPATVVEVARYTNQQATIQALSSVNGLVVSAASTRPLRLVSHVIKPARHALSLHSIAQPWLPATTTLLSNKPWSTLAAPGWVAVGQAGTEPLSVYAMVSSGELDPLPRRFSATEDKSTSIYGLALLTPSTLLAACYDSTVQLYDLRANDSVPSLSLADPWSDDACYSISTGGPGQHYVAVGTARHAAIRLCDLRSPSNPVSSGGATLFARKKERSPTYGVVLEYSRVYGVSERNTFVIDYEGGEGAGGRDEVGYYKHAGVGAGDFIASGQKTTRPWERST